jgi:Ca2+-binding RTX toxin-like protein
VVIARLGVEGRADEQQIAARLWDVAPDGGPQTLVARGLYRPTGDGDQVFELHANGWRFEPGHVAKLELLPNDTPYGRVSNGQGPVTVANLELRLPTLERSGEGAGGGAGAIQKPAPAVLPEGARPAPGIDAAARCETGVEMRGTKGNDRIQGTEGGDTLRGKRGKDRIAGKGGDDCINGNKGKDRLKGGDGDDRVRARDGERDRVNCGKGEDRVVADRDDKLRGCEERKRR